MTAENESLFKAELAEHLKQLERLCEAHNVLMVKITFLLRDPDNEGVVLLTNETPESLQVALWLATKAEVV
jgi:hypothetical protein